MIDEPDEFHDYNLARHIVALHQHREQAIHVDYNLQQLQRYIRYARTIRPKMTPEAGRCTRSRIQLTHSFVKRT